VRTLDQTQRGSKAPLAFLKKKEDGNLVVVSKESLEESLINRS
jgi:hypothetical protein